MTPQTVTHFLTSVLSREGYPGDVLMGHGPQFMSAGFKYSRKKRVIRHCYSSVYYPQFNGQVKRFNKVFKGIPLNIWVFTDARMAPQHERHRRCSRTIVFLGRGRILQGSRHHSYTYTLLLSCLISAGECNRGRTTASDAQI